MKRLYQLWMLLAVSVIGATLASCGDDDEEGEDISTTIADGWTDNGTTCYYKWLDTTHDRYNWIEYEFDGTSDEALVTKATKSVACKTEEGAKMLYNEYETAAKTGMASSLLGVNITNVKRNGTIVSYDLPDYISKTKQSIKKEYGLIADESDTSDESDLPTEPNVTESYLDGTWELYKQKNVQVQNKATVGNYTNNYTSDSAEGTFRLVFDLAAKTCIEQKSLNYGYNWENINSYTFKYYDLGDYAKIRFTDTVTKHEGDFKKITKLNSTELVIVWEYTLPATSEDPATNVTDTKYYKRIEQ